MEAKLAAIAKFCADNVGGFSLACGLCEGVPCWTAVINPGGASSEGCLLATGSTPEEAIDKLIAECRIEVAEAPANGGVAPELQKAADEGMGC